MAKAIEHDSSLAIEIEDGLGIPSAISPEWCITKVPAIARRINEAAYTPRIFSIGPLHHGEDHLRLGEEYKRCDLSFFLLRKPNLTVEHCLGSLRGMEKRVRSCYSKESDFAHKFTNDEFVKMMLLDGCHVVEWFLRHDFNTYRFIKYDLLLLENQLPFFVLEHLFDLIKGPEEATFFEVALPQICDQDSGVCRLVEPDGSIYQPLHVLDLYIKCFKYGSPNSYPTPTNIVNKHRYLPSATELHKAGIIFKAGSSDNGVLDLKFRDGVLEIPKLFIQDYTEGLFRNMIAMEFYHTCAGSAHHITDYVLLLARLVNTPNDVALLQSHGIIDFSLGNHAYVSEVVNRLAIGMHRDTEQSHYYGLTQQACAYYDADWNLWMAKLKRDHFSNPWMIISVTAALILLIRTAIQTLRTAVFNISNPMN